MGSRASLGGTVLPLPARYEPITMLSRSIFCEEVLVDNKKQIRQYDMSPGAECDVFHTAC